MLVLSRRPGESIMVGNDITITVIEVRGDQIRIGIDAPREIQVHREEVVRELEAQNAAAADSSQRAQRLVARLPANARRPGPGQPGQSGPPSGG